MDSTEEYLAPFLEVFSARGWRVEESSTLRGRHLSFDLVAEDDTSIVFLKVVSGHRVGETANELAGEIAALTMSSRYPDKAWEAYLLLLVSDGYEENLEVIQQLQYDFSFCRRVVLDLSTIVDGGVLKDEIDTALAFLFPFEPDRVSGFPHVRELLIGRLTDSGIDASLARGLVGNFEETECHCRRRIVEAVKRSDNS